LCVGHAHSTPVRWGGAVEVFGRTVQPGQLIHADKHGFMVIPAGEEAALLEAARFMDANECNTLIAAARSSAGLPREEVLARLEAAGREFARAARKRFRGKGEW
jgi:regulator of RNase E activity RraA